MEVHTRAPRPQFESKEEKQSQNSRKKVSTNGAVTGCSQKKKGSLASKGRGKRGTQDN